MAFTLKAKSLITNPNELSRAEGALDIADNVVIDRDDIIEPRRGFENYGDGLGPLSTVISQLMLYKDRIIAHYNGSLSFDADGLGSFSQFNGSFESVAEGLRMKYLEFGGNFYFTTKSGIKKISATSADQFSTNAGYITNAGGVKAVDLTAVISPNTSGFLPPQSKVAYRVMWGTTDANNRLILGSPSARSVLTNTSTNTTAAEKFSISIDEFNSINNTTTDYILFSSSTLDYFLWFKVNAQSDGAKPTFDSSVVDGNSPFGDIFLKLEALEVGSSDITINLDDFTGTFAERIAAYNSSVRTAEKVTVVNGDTSFTPQEGETITLTNGADPQEADKVPETAETIGRVAVEIDLSTETGLTSSKVADIVGNALSILPSYDITVSGNVVTLTSTEEGKEITTPTLGALVPSTTFTITSITKGAYTEGMYANAQLTITVPEEVTTDYYIQVYRTKVTTAVAGLDLDDIDPGEELNLVYEAGVKDSEIIAGEIIIEDIQSESFRDSGAPAYTNPLTGEGIINSNERPPIAKDISSFKNSAFYANTKNLHKTTVTMLSVADYISGESVLTIGNEEVAREYVFEGATQSQDIQTRADDTSKQTVEVSILSTGADLDKSYIVLGDSNGTVAFWVDLDNSGSPVPSHGADRPVKVTTITSAMTAGQVGTELYNAIIADSEFVGISDDTNGTFVVQAVDYGFTDTAFSFTEGNVQVYGSTPIGTDLSSVVVGEVAILPDNFITRREGKYIFAGRRATKGISSWTDVSYGIVHIDEDTKQATFIDFGYSQSITPIFASISKNIYSRLTPSSTYVSVSKDGGYTWQDTLVPYSLVYPTPQATVENTISSMVEAYDGSTLYWFEEPTNLLHKSLDNGVTWDRSSTVSEPSIPGVPLLTIYQLMIDMSNNLYFFNKLDPFRTNKAIYKSTDDGLSVTIFARLPTNSYFIEGVLYTPTGEVFVTSNYINTPETIELVSVAALPLPRWGQYPGISIKVANVGDDGFLYSVGKVTGFYRTSYDFSVQEPFGLAYVYGVSLTQLLSSSPVGGSDTQWELATVSPLRVVETAPGSDGTLTGKYFTINSASNERKYYVWFNNGIGGSDPSSSNDLGGRTSVEVKILPSDSADNVATALSTVLGNLDDFVTPSVFNDAVTYIVGNKVKYNDITYVCTQDTTNPEFQNPTDGLYWQIYANNDIVPLTWFKNGVVDPIEDFDTDFEFLKKQNILINRSPSQLNNTYFYINSANNTTEYYVWFSDGTGVDPLVPDKTGVQVLLAPTDGAFEIAPKLATALDSLDDFNASDDGANVVITWPEAAPVDDIVDVDSLLNITVTFDNNAVEGKGENTDTQTVLLSSLTSAAQSIDETARSLVRVINRDPQSPVYAFYDSGANDLPGIIRLENRDSRDIQFFVGATQEITTKYDPALPETIAVTAISDSEPTQITLSKDHGLVTGDYIYIHSTDSIPKVQGKFQVTATGLATFTIPINVTTAGSIGFFYRLDVASDNEEAQNRVYYSKTNLPEAVPALNYLDVGPKDESIQRIIPLRDSLFVLKTDGVYVISGTFAPNFTSRLLDSSVQTYAPDSAVVLNNKIYALSTQGIVSITDSGVSVVSRPIENKIVEVTRPGYNYQELSFGMASEADRAYHLWVPSSKTDTVATQCYRYNTFTRAWTRWTKSANCAVNDLSENLIYLGSGVSNAILQERKDGKRYDFSDESLSLEIATGGVSGSEMELSSAANVDVGDAIVQEQYVTLAIIRMLLKTLDIDKGLVDSDYFTTLEPSIGSDIKNTLNDISAKLVAEQNAYNLANGTSVAAFTPRIFNGSFEEIRDDYNAMIDELNDPSAITATKQYRKALDLIPYEVLVDSVNKQNNFITVSYEVPFIQGEITAYKAYECKVVYAAQHFGKPDMIKQVREATVMYDQSNFYKSYIGYASDISPNYEEEEFFGNGRGDWGDPTYGNQNWGGRADETPDRALVPREKQRNRFLRVRIRHLSAREEWAVVGVSFEPRLTSSRGYK